MFSSGIHHDIIWSDKCYLLVHIIVETHLLEVSMNCRWVHQPPPHPLLGLMMNPCSELASIVHLPRIFDVVSTICVAPFFSGILSLSYPDTNQIWISVRYDGWNIFPRVITLVFIWPGKVMSCLAHLAGGPIVISFLFSKVSYSSMRKL